MTWLKLSDDFADQCADLSDAAFRTHVEALLWAMRRENGGYVSTRDVTRLAESLHTDMAVTDLVQSGFWTIENDGYRIAHHMEHQPEPDVLTARRSLAAGRQRRKRRKAAQLDDESTTKTSGSSRRDDPRDRPRDDTRDPGRDGSGRERRTYEEQKSRAHEREASAPATCHVCGQRPVSGYGFDRCDECAAPAEARPPDPWSTMPGPRLAAGGGS